MENSLKPLDVSAFPRSVQIHSYSDIVRLGEKSNVPGCPPSSEDIAIIMFTSGSTGLFTTFQINIKITNLNID